MTPSEITGKLVLLEEREEQLTFGDLEELEAYRGLGDKSVPILDARRSGPHHIEDPEQVSRFFMARPISGIKGPASAKFVHPTLKSSDSRDPQDFPILLRDLLAGSEPPPLANRVHHHSRDID